MSLAQFSIRLMSGDDQAANHFVDLLPDDVRLAFGSKIAPMKELAYMRLLRDTAAFMAFKVPSPLVPLSVEFFRSLVDACLNDRPDELGVLISGLTLDEAYVIFSSGGRLIDASKRIPVVKGAPILRSDVNPLGQSEMF